MQYHIKVAIDGHFPPTSWEAEILKSMASEKITIIFDHSPDTWGVHYRGIYSYNSFRAMFTVELSDKFYTDYVETNSANKDLFINTLIKLKSGFEEIAKKHEFDLSVLLKQLRFSLFFFFFLGNEVSFNFIQETERDEILRNSFLQILELIKESKSKSRKFLKWINSVPHQKNKMRFLNYNNLKLEWELLDKLSDSTIRLSLGYRNDIKDERIKKPFIIFNDENYNEYFIWDHQWTLKMNEIQLIMSRPNDISLYVRIAKKSLKEAKIFFTKEIKSRRKNPWPLLREEETLEYYDYFETIISAIIFSYTSLETLANTCILPKYEFAKEKDGIKTIYSKEAIERNFNLRDKFKLILTDILITPDPTKEKWWDKFIKLESIRNEIIHTKQSKSEKRYSEFLSDEIFKCIEVYEQIIKYYGGYINANVKSLLIDFPYDFGADDITPIFMSNEDYTKEQRSRHGLV